MRNIHANKNLPKIKEIVVVRTANIPKTMMVAAENANINNAVVSRFVPQELFS